MTERIVTCTLNVHIAWWLMPYLRALAFICAMTGMEPNMGRVKRLIDKGITLKAEPVRFNPVPAEPGGQACK
jgi:hypothetical protein